MYIRKQYDMDVHLPSSIEGYQSHVCLLEKQLQETIESRDAAKAKVLALLEEVKEYRKVLEGMNAFSKHWNGQWYPKIIKEILNKYTPKDKEESK